MARIFLSYSRESLDFISVLVEDIEQLGHEVWYDRHLSGGQQWWDQILDQIRGCDIFITFMDPASLVSTACRRELAYADATGAPVLPILASDAVRTNLLPIALQTRQFVNYSARDHTAALRLARALASQSKRGPLPVPLPLPPELPVSYLAGLSSKIHGDAPLDFNQQKSLLFDLKVALENSESEADARILLGIFRRRPDLLSVIADDIAALTAVPEPASSATDKSRKKPFVTHLLRGLVGLILGGGFGVVAALTTYPTGSYIWACATGIGLAFAFLVAGGRRSVIAMSLFFGVIGWVGFFSIDIGLTSRDRFEIATIIILPSCLIVGGLFGRFMSWRKQPNSAN